MSKQDLSKNINFGQVHRTKKKKKKSPPKLTKSIKKTMQKISIGIYIYI